MANIINFITKNFTALYFAIILILSFTTYFVGYQTPALSQWDENYHISSAEKYLQGVMFMELHPPLGKLLIAAGEAIIQPNNGIDKSSFTSVDYIKNIPPGFSYVGFRLFPTIFGMMLAPLLFILLYLITRNSHISFAFSFLVVFDNALVIHSRAAMLESTQLFFHLISLIYFVWFLNKQLRADKHISKKDSNTLHSVAKISIVNYLVLGFTIGLGLAVKHTGALLLLLPFIWVLFEFKSGDLVQLNQKLRKLINLLTKVFIALVGSAVIYIGVFVIHVSLGQRINSNGVNNSGYYKAGDRYREALRAGETNNPTNFPDMFIDNLRYMSEYNEGVPKLNLCLKDAEGNSLENGSYALTWPFMNKTINYRWEKVKINQLDRTEVINDDIYNNLPNNEKGNYIPAVRYSQLIGNPIGWIIGLFGILLSLALIISVFIFGTPVTNKFIFRYILVFAGLYIAYMFVVMQIDRVMYLYHYFIPLIFSFILAALLFSYKYEAVFENNLSSKNALDAVKSRSKINSIFSDNLNQSYVIYTLIFGVALVVLSFYFFSPFTYYLPISSQEFKFRDWFDHWGLRLIE